MKKTLLKYKNIEDGTEKGCLQSTYPENVIETLQLVKLVDTIVIEDEYYNYEWTEFYPALSEEYLDVVIVFVSEKYVN